MSVSALASTSVERKTALPSAFSATAFNFANCSLGRDKSFSAVRQVFATAMRLSCAIRSFKSTPTDLPDERMRSTPSSAVGISEMSSASARASVSEKSAAPSTSETPR